MFNKFILVFGALFFLASCETATQDAVKGSAEKAGRVNLYKIDVTGFKELKIITPADASDPAWSPIIPWLNIKPLNFIDN